MTLTIIDLASPPAKVGKISSEVIRKFQEKIELVSGKAIS